MPTANEMLGPSTVQALAHMLTAVAPQRADHITAAPDQLAGLAMRQRVNLVADALLEDLGPNYADLADTVRHAAAMEPDGFSGWLIWPVTEAVARCAVADGGDHAFRDALALLAELTHRFSSEFAIRILLNHNVDAALSTINTWPSAQDEHIRRLASEGTRPFLPWGQRVPQLQADPEATLPILSALQDDPSPYVRRSVSNHLNDLSRNHPDLVVATARQWLVEPGTHTAGTVKHALRSLIKQGHPEALAVMGYGSATVDIRGPHVAESPLTWGGTLTFTVTLRNDDVAPARLLIDYVIHHLKANGTTSPKTFKWTTAKLAPGQTLTLTREHSFREITTRTYYPGVQAVAVQVSGVSCPPVEFSLLPRDSPS
ncbi:DNA alkylation repair protein [Kocuria sp.]|uniref:DNA alkylation repair protein n=1 Tax=Kocuria sp. TaxID=1871328 RepID=UPI0026E11078|nr:DNA alkylation repair protein [Kocuria sp.]MDO5618538.1 DNA alkylation repair protein [Kocuria sp.]